ncbi:MAG: hypothetical protein KAI55_03120 [Candidatus Aenigmarchaeota archaeon]|nr:hypothetical protein [Candidatus Aenigmarchaeota archaeon]
MKKIFVSLICVLFLTGIFVFASSSDSTDNGGSTVDVGKPALINEETGKADNISGNDNTERGNSTIDSSGKSSTNSGNTEKGNAAEMQQKVQEMNQLRNTLREQNEKMKQELDGMNDDKGNIYMNQNRVREAVHTLLALENFTGKMGPQISAIAKEFNNSVQSTIKAEEKIQTRSKIVRFFTGGDSKTANELEGEINQSRIKIQELKKLKEQCECDEEIKTMMQEQIQQMENEQTRLSGLAQKEKQSKGLLGWIWK